MNGYRQEDVGAGAPNPRAAARSYGRFLLSRLMQAYPDANDFRVRLIVRPDKKIDVEVTLAMPEGDAGLPLPVRAPRQRNRVPAGAGRRRAGPRASD